MSLRELVANATPGPWGVSVENAETPDPNYGPILAFIEVGNLETGEMACDCTPHLNDGSWEGEGAEDADIQCRDNARLIALAPEMAVLLADAMEYVDVIGAYLSSQSDPSPAVAQAEELLARYAALDARAGQTT